MHKKIFTSFLTFTALTYGDPLSYNLGTKASAVNGAYTALAHDISAAHYNPAGLIGKKPFVYLTFEASSTLMYNEQENKFSDEGGAGFALAIGGENMGGEFAWYSAGYNQDIMSLSYAYAPIKEVRLGCSAGIASVSLKRGDEQVDEESGGFVNVGMQITLLNTRDVTVDIGASYRTAQDFETARTNSQQAFAGYGMPSRAALGIAFTLPVSTNTMVVSADYVQYGYSDVATHTNVVSPMQDIDEITVGSSIVIFERVFIGGGYSTSKSTDSKFTLNKYSLGFAYYFKGKAKNSRSSLDVTLQQANGYYAAEDIQSSALQIALNFGFSGF